MMFWRYIALESKGSPPLDLHRRWIWKRRDRENSKGFGLLVGLLVRFRPASRVSHFEERERRVLRFHRRRVVTLQSRKSCAILSSI
jgi:hypothetical protein